MYFVDFQMAMGYSHIEFINFHRNKIYMGNKYFFTFLKFEKQILKDQSILYFFQTTEFAFSHSICTVIH